ncbi:hypothetical protein CRG98_021905, partial [Punica granatum]
KIEREGGSGLPIGDPDPSTEISDTCRGHQPPQWRRQFHRLATPTPNQPRTPSRRSPVDSGLRRPIDDPDPSIEIAGTHGGRRRPQWRGWGSPATSMEGSGLPIGGPDPSFPFDFLYRIKMK